MTVFKDTVPANVQNYHRHNGVRRFSSTKTWSPRSQNSPGGDEGVLQWVEKTILTSPFFVEVSGIGAKLKLSCRGIAVHPGSRRGGGGDLSAFVSRNTGHRGDS